MANNGGPDLSNIRGYSAANPSAALHPGNHNGVEGSSPQIEPPEKTTKFTPYSAEFGQRLIDVGIFPDGHMHGKKDAPEPANIEALREMLGEQRDPLSPTMLSDAVFREFKIKNKQAGSETQAMANAIPIMAGPNDSQHHSGSDVVFTRLHKFDKYISNAKPDMFYGASISEIAPRVRKELGRYIVPTGHSSRPVAPNFFLEGKARAGRLDVAENQAMYDGALGARGMLHLQNYGKQAMTYDGNAYTLSATYLKGNFAIYATHPSKSSRDGHTEYHMTMVDSFSMIGNPKIFRAGVAAFRNARDWAEAQRKSFIDEANETVRHLPVVRSSKNSNTANSIQGVKREPNGT